MNYFFYNTDARALREDPRPRFRVLIDSGFAAAGGDRKYGEQFGKLKPDDILLMYENEVGVVAIGRVLEHWDGVAHDTPQYYRPAEMSGLDGGDHEYRISVDWFIDLTHVPFSIEEIRRRFGYKPRSTVTRKTIDIKKKKRMEVMQLIEEANCASSLLPGEVAQSGIYIEGATRPIHANAYERSRAAIQECKARLGSSCIVCGFDFGSVYGAEFSGFIHVHHLRPLSEIGKEYEVNPVTDLCPVCPNCHAVIHFGGRLRSVKEVKQSLSRQKKASGQ